MRDYDPNQPPRQVLVAHEGTGRYPLLPDQGYEQPPPRARYDDDDEGDISLRDYWRVLVKRRWQVLVVALLVLAAAATYSLLDTPLYRASTVLEIESSLRIVKSEGIESTSKDWLTTQLALLRSRSVAERTVRELSLATDEAFQKSLQVKGGFAALWGLVRQRTAPAVDEQPLEQREGAAIGAVMGGLAVEPVERSRLVRVSFVSPDPQVAAKVANGISQVFMQSNLDRRLDNTQFARNFLQDQLQQLKQKLEDSERELIEYSQDQRIVNVDEYASLAAANLAQLTQALTTAQSERIKAEAFARQSRETKGASLDVLKSPVIETLRQRRVELQAQYDAKRSLYKADYPEMLQLQRQIDAVEKQIALEQQSYGKASEAQLSGARVNEQLIQQQIDQLRAEVLDLQSRSIQYSILKREADTNRQLYDGLLQRYKEIGVAGDVATNNIAVVDKALPGGRFKPDVQSNIFKGLLAGLLLGVLVALLLEKLDDTLKTPEDVERLLRLSVVGIVPKVPEEDLDVIRADPKSSFNEAYRSLRTALQYATENGSPRVLMVTSAVAGEGKSTTAVNIAKQFASLGQRVLIIDTDLRKPTLHTQFGLSNEAGLTEFLAGRAERDAVLQPVPEAGLTAITSGERPPNPAELLAVGRFAELLAWAAQEYDQVVVDCAPLLGLADVPTIVRHADGVLLAVEAGSTGVGVVRTALKRLAASRARILGAVLVQFDSRNTGYGYGYGYSYADHYYYYSSYGAYGSTPPEGGRAASGRRRRLVNS